MNYYPFHLGDYAAHTGHLEPMEDLAYRRLLDQYYMRETPLPADIQVTAKLIRLRSCIGDVESVLNEFFTLTDEGWRHARCDEELQKMQDKRTKAQASAAASVNARRTSAQRSLNERSTDAEQQTSVSGDSSTAGTPDPAVLNERSTNAQRSLPDTPTNAQRSLPELPTDVELPTPTPTPTPIEKTGAIAPSSTAKLPTCQPQKVVDLYHEVLPELPSVRVMDKAREKAIRDRWQWVLSTTKPDGSRRAATSAEALDWFRSYFGRARDNDFLMGRTPKTPGHENWKPDIEYLMKSAGLKQVLEKTTTETT